MSISSLKSDILLSPPLIDARRTSTTNLSFRHRTIHAYLVFTHSYHPLSLSQSRGIRPTGMR
jgi:hypothetical protein